MTYLFETNFMRKELVVSKLKILQIVGILSNSLHQKFSYELPFKSLVVVDNDLLVWSYFYEQTVGGLQTKNLSNSWHILK